MSDALDKAASCLSILAIDLRKSKILVRDNIELIELDREDLVNQTYRNPEILKEFELKNNDGGEVWEYHFYYALGVRLVPTTENDGGTGDDYEAPIEITATFNAKYLCNEKLDQESLNEFFNVNVGFNIWPFWREFVQSSCSRLGLTPPIEIPLYRYAQPEE